MELLEGIIKCDANSCFTNGNIGLNVGTIDYSNLVYSSNDVVLNNTP